MPAQPSESPEPTVRATPDPGATPDAPTDPLEDLTYEQAREELVGVVARLEAGGETLEGSLALWERGEALAARCQQWLDGARARLEAVRGATTTTATTTTGTTTTGTTTPEATVTEATTPQDEDA